MTVEMLKGKIHRATVIQAELDYVFHAAQLKGFAVVNVKR